jgi:hypothetical protein
MLPPSSGEALGPATHECNNHQLYYSKLALRELLEVALQLPPGLQQQAWLDLLCQSQLAAHMGPTKRAPLGS